MGTSILRYKRGALMLIKEQPKRRKLTHVVSWQEKDWMTTLIWLSAVCPTSAHWLQVQADDEKTCLKKRTKYTDLAKTSLSGAYFSKVLKSFCTRKSRKPYDLNRGSLHTRGFRCIHVSVFRYIRTKNGFTAQKVSGTFKKWVQVLSQCYG